MVKQLVHPPGMWEEEAWLHGACFVAFAKKGGFAPEARDRTRHLFLGLLVVFDT